MEDYTFGAFFVTLCYKQGVDPITKKMTCKEWMESCLSGLSMLALKRLAQKAPEILNVEMYKLPNIKQLMDLHCSLEKSDPLATQKEKCNICGGKHWIILVNIETGEEVAARCQCMLPYARKEAFAKDLLNTGHYVTYDDYSKREEIISEPSEKVKKFLKRTLGTNSLEKFKKRKS